MRDYVPCPDNIRQIVLESDSSPCDTGRMEIKELIRRWVADASLDTVCEQTGATPTTVARWLAGMGPARTRDDEIRAAYGEWLSRSQAGGNDA